MAFIQSVPLHGYHHLVANSQTCHQSITRRRKHSSSYFITESQPKKTILWTAQISDSTSSPSLPIQAVTWSRGESNHEKVTEAVKEAVAKASSTLQREGTDVSIMFIFIKSNFEGTPDNQMKRVISVAKKTMAIRRILGKHTQIFGCTTADYCSPDDEPTCSVVLAHFPTETTIHQFSIPNEQSINIDWKQEQWYDLVGVKPQGKQSSSQTRPAQMQMLLLQHPDFELTQDVVSGLDFAYPELRKFGASAGRTSPLHEAYLFDTNGCVNNGILGLVFASEHIQVDVTVAQGARGVGPLLEVTEVKEGSEIAKVKEIGTPGAAEAAPMVLFDMWARTDVISQEDKTKGSKYLLFGVEVPTVVDLAASSLSKQKGKTPESQKPVDMIVKKVVAFNDATKTLMVDGTDVRLGSRCQFQIRDEEAARSELNLLFDKLRLEGSSKAMDGMSLMGSLLLVDTERGPNLYGNVTPNLDQAMYTERFPVPMALLTSDRQVGPLPAGGLLGTAGNTFLLSASALYVSFYGRTSDPVTFDENSQNE